MSENVVVYRTQHADQFVPESMSVVQNVAETVARLKQSDYLGFYRQGAEYQERLFIIPDATLLLEEAKLLQLRDPGQFFGGCVPYPFARTKAISHQLINDGARRPAGWSTSFGENIRNAVLPGFTAFDPADADAGAQRMLMRGPFRLKEPLGDSGRGQILIKTIKELSTYVESYPSEILASYGIVLEENLNDVVTFNVGQIVLDGDIIAYFGRQRTTKDNQMRSVFGGSDMVCVPGGWGDLLALQMSPELKGAVLQARCYDAATSEFAGFMASRRNYDVAVGVDGRGARRSGVLEASWRLGGLTSGELAALNEFRRDPTISRVDVSVIELYGKNIDIPRGATVQFQGEDPILGPLTRYTILAHRESGHEK